MARRILIVGTGLIGASTGLALRAAGFDGEIVGTGNKRTLWVNVKVNDNPQVMRDINEKFLKYYSVTQANYEALGHHFVPNPYALEVDASHV